MELKNNTDNGSIRGANDHNTSCQHYDQYLYEHDGDLTGGTLVRSIFVVLYSLIFLAGVSGNACVVLAVAKNKALQTVRNLFIVSLSASDLVVCLFSLPISASTSMYKTWEFGEALCYAIPMFQGMSVFISTFTLTCIAIDRFILIIFPTKRPIQVTHAVVMIAVVWTLAMSMTLPMVINQKLVTYSYYSPGDDSFCKLQHYYYFLPHTDTYRHNNHALRHEISKINDRDREIHASLKLTTCY